MIIETHFSEVLFKQKNYPILFDRIVLNPCKQQHVEWIKGIAEILEGFIFYASFPIISPD